MPRKYISADSRIADKNIDVDDLYRTYMTHSARYTAQKFHLIGQNEIMRILEAKNFDTSSRDLKKINLDNYIAEKHIDVSDLYHSYMRNSDSFIARKFNISISKISEILIAEGYDITNRPSKDYLAHNGKLNSKDLVETNDINVDALYETYMNNGKDYTAKAFGLSNYKLVERILKDYNFDISQRDSKSINSRKTSETLYKRYGYGHALQIPSTKEKLIRTCQSRYGQDSYMGCSEFREKSKETNLKRYGYEWSTQCPEVKARHDAANYLKYGVKDFKQSSASELLKIYLNDKDKSIDFLSNNPLTFAELLKYFKDDKESQIASWLYRFDLYGYLKHECRSYPETQLADFLDPLGFTSINDRKVLGNGQEIDIYNPTLKIGVEFNGTYYHSSKVLEDKNYHYSKSKLAESKGIRLIHIYEYEWQDRSMRDKLKSILKIASGMSPSRIYARNCEIRQISNKEAEPFNEMNHLQRHRNAQITYGLFHKGKLVQLMSFSKTKYNRNLKGDNDWEIIRGCPGSNNIVVGGVSKLFKHFIREMNPDHIFSYCDFNKFDGKGYEAIGMKFIGYTGPDKKWIIGNKVVNRNPYRYHELKNLASAIIWGAGSKKYVWENPLITIKTTV